MLRFLILNLLRLQDAWTAYDRRAETKEERKRTRTTKRYTSNTVPLETISAFACGNTSSLPIVFTAKSPRLDENRNRGKDESNRMPRPT